jgi:hypothetical protein
LADFRRLSWLKIGVDSSLNIEMDLDLSIEAYGEEISMIFSSFVRLAGAYLFCYL